MRKILFYSEAHEQWKAFKHPLAWVAAPLVLVFIAFSYLVATVDYLCNLTPLERQTGEKDKNAQWRDMGRWR